MYKVNFLNSTNSVVLHTLSLLDGLNNIKLNADKIAGTSYFAKEPKRLEFECFADSWLENNILAGNNEFDRYISKFIVRLYNENSLVFTGIIDTSFVSFDAKTETLRFTCYDFLRLFTKFDDLSSTFSRLDGYHPGYCLGYFVQSIEQKVDFNINNYWANTWQALTINKTLELYTIKWGEILAKFDELNAGWRVWAGFSVTAGNVPEFRLVICKEHEQGNEYKFRIYACKIRFYNNVCAFKLEDETIDEESPVFPSYPSLDDYFNRFRNHRLRGYFNGDYWQCPLAIEHQGNSYSFEFSTADYNFGAPPATKIINFAGNVVPENLHAKNWIEDFENTEFLAMLKASLMLHNLTIVSNANGSLSLVNKNDSNNVSHQIDLADIIEFKRKRLNRQKPDVSVLDCLAGELKHLKTAIKEYYDAFFAQTWELESIIDNCEKYNLNLFDKILINNKLYMITELKKDIEKDEYSLKGWEIDLS